MVTRGHLRCHSSGTTYLILLRPLPGLELTGCAGWSAGSWTPLVSPSPELGSHVHTAASDFTSSGRSHSCPHVHKRFTNWAVSPVPTMGSPFRKDTMLWLGTDLSGLYVSLGLTLHHLTNPQDRRTPKVTAMKSHLEAKESPSSTTRCPVVLCRELQHRFQKALLLHCCRLSQCPLPFCFLVEGCTGFVIGQIRECYPGSAY